MKKRIKIFVSLAFLVGGIAMAVVIFKCNPRPWLQTLFGCLYAASGLGAHAAFVTRNSKGWQRIALVSLLGIILTGRGWFFSTMLVVVSFCAVLYRALLGPDEEESDNIDIELPPGSGFLLKSTDNNYFQLLRGRDQLCLVYLGSRYYPYANRVIRSEDDYESGEMDRAIPFDRIRAIRILRGDILRIRCRHGGRFFARPPATVDDVAAYLLGLPVSVRRLPAPRLPTSGARAQNVLFAISFASGLCAAAWMYLDAPVRLLATVNTIFFAISFALFCVFFDFLESEEAQRKGIEGGLGWIFPLIPFLFHFVRDHNFHSFSQFIAPVGILAGCMLLVFLVRNARRRPWGMTLEVLFIAIISSVLIVGNLNILLDDGASSDEKTAIVQNRESHLDEDRSDPYELRLGAPVEGKWNVSQDVYEAVTMGEEVLVVTRTGIFGIDYTVVEIPD